jgi:hypothetical protein
MTRHFMDRFIDTIEWIAAGFVGIVAVNIFVAVLLRNLFSYSIPDSFDIGRLLLGILIFWGIAATSYRGTHITVDLIWGNVGPKYQRLIDVFATLVLLFVVTVQTWTPCHDLRPASADLAVLRGRLDWRRLCRASDCDPDLSADLPSRGHARPQVQEHGVSAA